MGSAKSDVEAIISYSDSLDALRRVFFVRWGSLPPVGKQNLLAISLAPCWCRLSVPRASFRSRDGPPWQSVRRGTEHAPLLALVVLEA